MNPIDILLVDDDLGILDTFKLILEMEGYRVATAENGYEAMKYLQAHPSPRLILLDLMMPEMDGLEFLNLQRKNPELSKIPVVVMSAHANLKRNIGSNPGLHHLSKPIELDQLLSTVRAFCDSQSSGVDARFKVT
jgi:CheY-like chemotaxis protein